MYIRIVDLITSPIKKPGVRRDEYPKGIIMIRVSFDLITPHVSGGNTEWVSYLRLIP
jgi:hypothetical protein